MKKVLLLLVLALGLGAAPVAMKAADDFTSLIFNHRIAIGMSFGNVQAAWGKPDDVTRTVSGAGTKERWYYREKHSLVVFENGRVSSFSEF
jgi:hypothetical protein